MVASETQRDHNSLDCSAHDIAAEDDLKITRYRVPLSSFSHHGLVSGGDKVINIKTFYSYFTNISSQSILFMYVRIFFPDESDVTQRFSQHWRRPVWPTAAERATNWTSQLLHESFLTTQIWGLKMTLDEN